MSCTLLRHSVRTCAHLLHCESQAIAIAIQIHTEQLLHCAGCSTLTPESASARPIHTAPSAYRLPHTLGIRVAHTEADLRLIHNHGGEEAVGAVALEERNEAVDHRRCVAISTDLHLLETTLPMAHLHVSACPVKDNRIAYGVQCADHGYALRACCSHPSLHSKQISCRY